jgi:hypothetical protein
MPEEPIATYYERRLEGSRQFFLFSKEIRVRLQGSFGAAGEASVVLASLRPAYNRMRARHFIFVPLLVVTIAGVASTAFLLSPTMTPVTRFTIAFVGLLIAALAGPLAWWVSKPVEWAQFVTDGNVPALNIGNWRDSEHAFRAFLDKLVAAIEKERCAPSSPTTTQTASAPAD